MTVRELIYELQHHPYDNKVVLCIDDPNFKPCSELESKNITGVHTNSQFETYIYAENSEETDT